MIIKKGFPVPKNGSYKVYVRSITYNQSSFIEDCLNGVAVQETNFPYIHHIIDDASTDGEQAKIKAWIDQTCNMEYAEYYDNDICNIIVAKYNKNPNCTIVAYFLKKNMYRDPQKIKLYEQWQDICIYEAICEGDDYWTDKRKLQIQADFLDSNQDYGLCCTGNQSKLEGTNKIIDDNKYEGEITYPMLLVGNRIATLTTLYRISILKKYNNEINPMQHGWLMDDYPKWLYFAHNSKIMCDNIITACYRILPGSASRPTSIESKFRYIESVYSVRFFYIDYYKEYVELKQDMIAEKYYCKAGVYFERKKYMLAIKELKKCPFNCYQFVKRVAKLILRIPS